MLWKTFNYSSFFLGIGKVGSSDGKKRYLEDGSLFYLEGLGEEKLSINEEGLRWKQTIGYLTREYDVGFKQVEAAK